MACFPRPASCSCRLPVIGTPPSAPKPSWARGERGLLPLRRGHSPPARPKSHWPAEELIARRPFACGGNKSPTCGGGRGSNQLADRGPRRAASEPRAQAEPPHPLWGLEWGLRQRGRRRGRGMCAWRALSHLVGSKARPAETRWQPKPWGSCPQAGDKPRFSEERKSKPSSRSLPLPSWCLPKHLPGPLTLLQPPRGTKTRPCRSLEE